MKIEQFQETVTAQVARCLTVLDAKSNEYALGDDRLEHFKTAADMQSITPKQALWGMAAKHFTSLASMCKNDKGSIDLWDEKITDSINYLFLLRALAEETKND
jgi:hypothetical protein